jgi:transposase
MTVVSLDMAYRSFREVLAGSHPPRYAAYLKPSSPIFTHNSFARAEVEARLTARGVEIFHKGERIAVHLRASGNRKHTTVPEHMPSSHRRYAGWTIERIREDARKIGPATATLCEQILEARPHPEQGYRACLGIVRLAGSYGAARVEAAAERAIEIGARTYGSVKSILDARLDRRPAPKRPAETAPIRHPNIRGPRYYH